MSDHKDKKLDHLAEDTDPAVKTANQSDPQHESQDSDTTEEKSDKVVIVTSAMDEDFLTKSLGSNKQKDIVEVLPQLHSKITHIAQGNTYKNSLDLAFDRLLSGADAPEYVAPEKPEVDEDEDENSAFEEFHFGESLGSLEVSESSDDLEPDTVPVTPELLEEAFEPKSKILGEFSVSELDKLKVDDDPNTDIEGFSMDDFNRLTQTPVADIPREAKEVLESDDTILTPSQKLEAEETTNFETDPFTLDSAEPIPDYWLEEEE